MFNFFFSIIALLLGTAFAAQNSDDPTPAQVAEWDPFGHLLVGQPTKKIMEHQIAEGRDVEGACKALYPSPPKCDCDLTNKLPFANNGGDGWGSSGDDDYCPVGTVGWNYAICLQTSDVDVEKTRGTITLSLPTSGCANNVQQEIVCKIDNFRVTPPFRFTFPGIVFFTAAGRASYDGATHPCYVRFGYDGVNNIIDFILQNGDADLDNGWIYTTGGYPPFGTWYRQAFAGGPEQGPKFTDNMFMDFAHCGILPE